MNQEPQNTIAIDGVSRRKQAEKNAKQNDMKQHADKLIQGFQKIGESHSRRAIWELFQNAIDLCEQDAEIIIEHTDESLTFKHNGKPFDDNTLNCLIKQVSSKAFGNEKFQEEADEQVGQYGTGFITTHSFGRKLLLTGSIEEDGRYIPLNKFEIDRSPKDSKTLVDNLYSQQEAVFDLIEKGIREDSKTEYTEFCYLTETEPQKKYALLAVEEIPYILPYVMVLNHKIKKVTVTDSQNKTVYERQGYGKEKDVYLTDISINGQPHQYQTLEDHKEGITVILPIKANNQSYLFDERVPRLFLYYPLIGAEKLGINFIIHSKYFSPTEPRDGIHLNSENDQVKDDEKANQLLIEKASKMVFEYQKTHAHEIKNPINLAQINFNTTSDDKFLNEYFKKLKQQWIDVFKELPLVETAIGTENIKPSQARFLHSLLLQNPEVQPYVYAIVSKFWSNIPAENIVSKWTVLFDEWNIQNAGYVTIQDVVEKIETEKQLHSFGDLGALKKFYQYLIEHGYSELFNARAILPNIRGEFRKQALLNSSVDLPEVLISIADELEPEISKKQIDSAFKFSLELTTYNKKHYSDEIRNSINVTIPDDATSASIIEMKSETYFNRFLDYCKIATTSTSDSAPSKVVRHICKYYNYSEDLIPVPQHENEKIDNRSAQIKLIRVFVNDIYRRDKAWVENNLVAHKEFVTLLEGYSDYKELFSTLSIFPNQLFELCVQSRLHIDDKIPDEIKDLYDRITKPDVPVRATLAHPNFAMLLSNPDEKKTTNSLTEKIEDCFSPDRLYNDINENEHKKDIIEIINKLSGDSKWQKYFPILTTRRANIMLDTVTDENTKNEVFSILSLAPEKIKKIGAVSNNPNLERIIDLGVQAFQKELHKEADFQHKHALGTHLEDVLTSRLKSIIPGEIKARPEPAQNGQDIIIYVDTKPVYYIEVKSKWVSETPIRMSRNQTLKCYKHSDAYSLCSIDMVDYAGEDREKIKSLENIEGRIRFNTDIGTKVEHLINVLEQTDVADEIRLDGEFRTYIPKSYIEEGITLKEFEEFLIKELQNSYAK